VILTMQTLLSAARITSKRALIWRRVQPHCCCRLTSRPSTSSSQHQRVPYEYNHPSLIDVSELAWSMREEVRAYTKSETVRLVGVLAEGESGNYRSDAELYSEQIAEIAKEDGISYQVCRCEGKDPADVLGVIRDLNEREDVHGVLVFYPIFKQRMARKEYLNRATGVHYKTQDDYIRDMVSPTKDVEGLCHDYNSRWLFRARGMNRTTNEAYIPCTALAVMKILETYHSHHPNGPKQWSGLNVTVVNRSEILGRPLAALLALEGATVYSVDDKSILMFSPGGRMRRCPTLALQDCLEKSSVVVTGVPSPDFLLKSQHIASGSTVVNVSEFINVDEESLLERPNIKLIPHIGKVTCAALQLNLIHLHEKHFKE
jgi:methylenetetrahydrofolate dehydrogenase (NAD+)